MADTQALTPDLGHGPRPQPRLRPCERKNRVLSASCVPTMTACAACDRRLLRQLRRSRTRRPSSDRPAACSTPAEADRGARRRPSWTRPRLTAVRPSPAMPAARASSPYVRPAIAQPCSHRPTVAQAAAAELRTAPALLCGAVERSSGGACAAAALLERLRRGGGGSGGGGISACLAAAATAAAAAAAVGRAAAAATTPARERRAPAPVAQQRRRPA